MGKELLIDFNAKLRPEDTPLQTFGCRQKNPNICGNNMMPNICAFVCPDKICKKPSRAWKKQFELLKNK